ncbi:MULTISPECIES: NUDIX domain-containing protein [Gammaproteobacteria]|uniref:NUDIX domain-containing protein n=1 Tax=Gammaproteobacteria TaxID=1236 RepID=UPI000DD0E78B|nr:MULTISPECIES: NUDIX domain-containing protein [Gammaproteobacteria]RTE87692.1 NUDIX domain-containing protein [Aliidiomarina sp. B3213]TCZ92524.1 NUDIX domain-containing protein [Lysobacter sp. N42]
MANIKSLVPFGQEDVEIISTETVYHGFYRVKKSELRHRLFEGGWSPVISREIMDRGHAVVVLPYDPVRDTIVMLTQFRVGAVQAGGAPVRQHSNYSISPWLVELVAGMIDEGESEEDVAFREMQEEAGLTPKALHFATSYLSSPGGLTERISIYVAQVDATQASAFGGLAEEHEDIKVTEVPRTEVIELLEAGVLDNAATLIGIQWLMLNREKLLQDWDIES